jgi:hypothetical protein
MTTMSPELLAALKGAKTKYSNNAKAVKLKEGKTTIRILATPGVFWREVGVHWIKGGEKEKPVAVVGCYDATKNEPCPICAAIAKASAAAVSDGEVKMIADWKAGKGVLVNALIKDGPSKSDMAQVLELTPTTWGAIAGMMEEYEVTHGINVLDPIKGRDFVIERAGQGFNTKYTVIPSPVETPVSPAVFEKLHDLDQWIEANYFRGDHTKALLAMGNFSGMALAGPSAGPALAAPAGAPALTGPAIAAPVTASALEEEVLREIEPTIAPPVAPVAPSVSVPAAAPAAVPAAPAPAAAATVAPASLSTSDVDALLNSLG